MCQIDVSFICSIGIFSDREILELLRVSLSFEDLLPRLASFLVAGLASVLFEELFHLYLFMTIENVVDFVNHVFFLLGECQPYFHL